MWVWSSLGTQRSQHRESGALTAQKPGPQVATGRKTPLQCLFPIHLSSSFGKHALMLSMASCSCKIQPRSPGATLLEQRAQDLALPQAREKRNDRIFHCMQHPMILPAFEQGLAASQNTEALAPWEGSWLSKPPHQPNTMASGMTALDREKLQNGCGIFQPPMQLW